MPTAEFFSPSSDYYSLSPSSPPPSYSPSNSSSPPPQPIYAKVNKAKVASPEKTNGTTVEVKDEEKKKVNEEVKEEVKSDVKEEAKVEVKETGKDARKGSLPLYPERPVQERKRGEGEVRGRGGGGGESRRHSWAGGRGPASVPSGKQTSLQDFKRLLAQQTPVQNPHRVSAKQLLERTGEVESSQTGGGGGGSVRKRNSPWKDKRFSVIQEEPGEENGKSRESLLNGKR